MLPRIVSGLAENTNSIFCDGLRARYSEWMSGSATAGTTAERHMCELVVPRHRYCALLKKRASRDVCFLLTNDLHGCRRLVRGLAKSATPAKGRASLVRAARVIGSELRRGHRGSCTTIRQPGLRLLESRSHAAYVFGASIVFTSCHALTASRWAMPLLSAM